MPCNGVQQVLANHDVLNRLLQRCVLERSGGILENIQRLFWRRSGEVLEGEQQFLIEQRMHLCGCLI